MDWRDWDEPRAERFREIDFALVRDAVAAWKWRLIAAPLAALILICIFLLAATPRYKAEAQVLLGAKSNPGLFDDSADEFAAVMGQAQLVASRDLARRAIKELGIEARPEFDPLTGGLGPAARTLILLGFMRDPARMSPEERILKAYEDRLSVTAPSRTRLVTISFQSEDRDLAARAANRIADLYLEMRANATQAGSGDSDARVVSRATAPSLPTFPNHGLLLVFGASATFFTALATFVSSAVLRALPNGLAQAPADEPVEQPRALGEPPVFARLGETVSLDRQPPRNEFTRRANADDAEALAEIVERIASARSASRGARIVFTSLASADAAPQMMLTLGRLLGREGRSIVVPLDKANDDEIWKSPADAPASDAAPSSSQPRLGDLLAGRASFAEVIRRDPGSRLHFVAAGFDETIDLCELSSVLEALARTYDFILLTAPPLDADDLAKTLAPDADFVVLSAPPPPRENAAFAAKADLIACGAREVLVIGAPALARPSSSQDAA